MNARLLALPLLLILSLGIIQSNEAFAQTLSYDGSDGSQHLDTNNDGACNFSSSSLTNTNQLVRAFNTAASSDCTVSDIEFTLPSLANATSITSATLSLQINSNTNNTTFDVRSIDFDDLSTRSDTQRFASLIAGTDYVSTQTPLGVGLFNFTINAAGIADILSAVQGGGGAFSIGLDHDSFSQDATVHTVQWDSPTGTNPPELTFTYTTTPAPDAVDDLVADVITGGGFDLNWTEPGLNGETLINYALNSTTPTGDPLTFVGNTTSSDYSVTGLTPNTTYSFRASALTAGGYNVTGANILNVTTINVYPPTSISVDTPTLTSLLLTWVAPVTGDALNGFLIERESPIGGGFATIVANTTTTGVTYTDTGLTSGTQYNYRVTSLAAAGASAPSPTGANYTLGAPIPPTGLTVSSTSDSSLTLDWTASDPNGFPVTGYLIARESPTGGGFATLVNDTGSTDVSYVDTGLSALTQYNYKVSGWNSEGNGSFSTAVANYTLPDSPTSLIVYPEGTSTTDLNLEWVAPGGGVGINGYKIERAPSVGGTFATISANTTNSNTFYNDTGLVINTYYNYRVSALGNTTVDPSDPSNTYSQTTYHLPDSVDDLTATEAGFGSALLEWTTPDTLYGYVLGYMINYTTPQGDPTSIYTNSTGSSAVSAIVGLPINDYSYRVSAVTVHGTNASAALIANFTTSQQTTLGDLDSDFSEQTPVATIPITFALDTINGTQSTVQVLYDSAMDLDCNIAYKYSRSNSTYSGLTENPLTGSEVYTNFTFNDPANEIIDISCVDSLDGNNTGTYQLSEGEIPFFSQASDFQAGTFGTQGMFGIFDLLTLFVVIIAMIGFNRYNPAVGVVIMVSMLGALAFYGLIELSGLILGVLALIIVLAIGTVRKS